MNVEAENDIQIQKGMYSVYMRVHKVNLLEKMPSK